MLWEGQHLEAVARGRWEFVRRRGTSGVVVIVAITDDERIILVEQYRPPIARPAIELPAGLAGDLPHLSNEPLIEAGRRELLEETGYEAGEMVVLTEGFSTPGLSDELVTLLLARDLRKIGDGGGDESEQITVHEVPLAHLNTFVEHHAKAGAAIDFKIYAGLYLAQQC